MAPSENFLWACRKKRTKENSKTGRSGVVKGTILCKMCNRTFSFTIESIYSLKSHYKKAWYREQKCTDETGSVDSCFWNVSFATCKWPVLCLDTLSIIRHTTKLALNLLTVAETFKQVWRFCSCCCGWIQERQSERRYKIKRNPSRISAKAN